MKSNKVNRMNIFKILLVILVIPMITGCEKNNTINKLDEFQYAYSEEIMEIKGIDGDLICADYNDGYFIVTEQEGRYWINTYNSNDESVEKFELILDEGMKLRTISKGEKFYVVLADDLDNHFLSCFDMNGNQEKMIPLEGVKENGINRIVSDCEGNVIFSNSSMISVYDGELNYLFSLDEKGEEIISVATCSKGNILALVQRYNGTTFKYDYYIETLDIKKGKLKDKKMIDGEIAYHGKVLIDSNVYDGCIRMEDGIYVFKNDSFSKIMDYNSSFLTMDDTERFFGINEDLFSVIESVDERCYLKIYTKTDGTEIANKKEILVGCYNRTDALTETIVDFNKNSDEYFVRIIDYSMDEEGAEKLSLDISNGKGPDIFQVGGYLSVNELIQKGILENLDQYIEQDREFEKADFIDEYMKATEYSGSTYMIADSFSISTLVTKKNDYLTEYGCSYDEFDEYIKMSGTGAKILWQDLSKEDLFAFFMDNAIDYYIDYEKSECHLNTQEFKEILKLCNDNGVNGEVEYKEFSQSEFFSAYSNGEALFIFDPTPDSLNQFEKMFGDEICICGYPEMGSFFSPHNGLCLNSQSSNKDGAWEFMRLFLTKEHQFEMLADGFNIPTRKDAYEALKDKLVASEDYVDEFGNEIKALEVPVSEKYIVKYDELIKHTNRCVYANFDIEKIMIEEASTYFAGEHELDVAVELMENRVNTYLKEHR